MPCPGASKATTEKPCASSGAMKPRSWVPRPPQPCTSTTAGSAAQPRRQAMRRPEISGIGSRLASSSISSSSSEKAWRGGVSIGCMARSMARWGRLAIAREKPHAANITLPRISMNERSCYLLAEKSGLELQFHDSFCWMTAWSRTSRSNAASARRSASGSLSRRRFCCVAW